MQETPAQDIAVAGAVIAVLKALSADVAGAPLRSAMDTAVLARILLDTARDGELAVVGDRAYLELFGFPGRRCEARELWHHLLESQPDGGDWKPGAAHILANGCLARRLTRAVGRGARRPRIREAWRMLCECLENGRVFEGID
jgi:hypothetical protein